MEKMITIDDQLQHEYQSTAAARDIIQNSVENTSQFMQDEIQNLEKLKFLFPNPKGTWALSAKLLLDALTATDLALQDLQPEKIRKAVIFVKSNRDWLKINDIPAGDELDSIARINHDYKLTV